MPKEITHWLIADEALRRLRQSLPARELRREFVMLGATFHDVLYYARRKRGEPSYWDAADILHGAHGEDTLEIVRFLLAACLRHPRQTALPSFLLGVITHIAADTVFHPFIYWTAGDWRGKEALYESQRRHRALEAAIDVYFCAQKSLRLSSFSLYQYRKQAGRKGFEEIITLLAGFSRFAPWSDIKNALRNGYNNLALARFFFYNRLANRIVSAIERGCSARTRTFTALRYYTENRTALPVEALSHPHPVTGEPVTSSIDEMFERSVQESLRLFAFVEESLQNGDIETWSEWGKSLEVGLERTPINAMKHFAPASTAGR